jgi:hypothetical protein
LTRAKTATSHELAQRQVIEGIDPLAGRRVAAVADPQLGADGASPDSMVAGDHLDANVERIIPEEYNFAIGSRSEQMLP